jgi:hypothetical protein
MGYGRVRAMIGGMPQEPDMTARHLPLPLLLAVAAAFGVAGCTQNKAPAPATAETPTAAVASPAAAQSPAATGEAADLAQREAELARRESELVAREAALKPKNDAGGRPKPVAKPTVTASAARAGHDAASAPAAAPVKPAPPAPVVVPAGTPISIALNSDITTKTARVGDPVDAHVTSAVTVDGRTAIPAGTLVRGLVSEVVSGSDRIGGTPTLGLKFDGIELQPGRTVGISGNLHEQGKSDTARDTAKIAGGALLGAIIGKQIGDNKGRLIGGLLGGAAGVAAAKKTGTEVTLPAGTTFTVVLDQSFSTP